MKKILLILITMSASQASISQDMIVNQIATVPDFDAMFVLTNKSDHLNYAKLDCQSYFQKFDTFDKNNNMTSENYISFDECEYIYKATINCLDTVGTKCIDSNDIFSDECECK